MATANHIYVIPDQGGTTGGDLYDRWGNLSFFADVTSLTDKTRSAVDKSVTVKSHSRNSFMRDPAPTNVGAFAYSASFGLRRSKGGYPGDVITLVSDLGLPGQEKRTFHYTGSMSALVAWLKTTAKMQINLFGPTNAPYDPIPAAGVNP